MTTLQKPDARPANPRFSSGPCTKRPGWSLKALEGAPLGRSHRAKPGKEKLAEALALTRDVLQVPETHKIAIVPGSDTGAVEMAMWTLLGPRGVDVAAWESFGGGWVTDALEQLKLPETRAVTADYGVLPDLASIDFSRDVVFTWNGTTSGVRVPNGDWIPADREGLTICDATSAAFAQRLDFDKLDVTTFSWQKVLGGEAAHGVIILGPRAIARLETHTPPWPVPKLFRLTQGGKLIKGLFEGDTINTPSMLCVEDYIDTLSWARRIGGLDAMIARADASLAVMADWIARTDWVDFLARDPETRSNTSICLSVTDPAVASRPLADQAAFAKALVARLEAEGVAFDIGSYRDAPPGLRIWSGGTVESADLAALTPWLDWAFAAEKNVFAKAA